MSYLEVVVMLFCMKQKLTGFKLKRNKIRNGPSNIKETSTERFQLQMLVLHQSKYISRAGPSSLRDVQKEYKDKLPDVSDSHQNIRTSCNFKLK